MGVKVNMKGLKDFQKKINSLNRPVSFDKLFTGSFMRKYTNFSTFDELLESGGFKVNSKEDFEAIPDLEFDIHIRKTTKFDSWESMKSTAGTEYVKHQLG